MEKLYAYVDETGQETAGAFFLVAVVVAGEERDALVRLADTMAGFLRDAEEGKAEWQARFLRAQNLGILRKV
jgi:hypothetical protein